MQAMKVKRFAVTRVQRISIITATIGALAVGAVGANALHEATAGSEASSVAVTRNGPHVAQMDTLRFLEWNTQLPSAVGAPVQTAAEIQFLEWNTLLPSQAATPSFADMRFLELNTLLPGDVTAAVESYAERQFLEQNTELPVPVAANRSISFERIEFLESNHLPGDDAPLTPPTVTIGSPS